MTGDEQTVWLARIEADATVLVETLRQANDAGVSHALVLPRLVTVFRAGFGEPPDGFAFPTFPAAVPT